MNTLEDDVKALKKWIDMSCNLSDLRYTASCVASFINLINNLDRCALETEIVRELIIQLRIKRTEIYLETQELKEDLDKIIDKF